MRRFLLEKFQKETFWLFRRLRKIKTLKNFQSAEFQLLLLHLQDLYRLQNLANVGLDLESIAFRARGHKLEGEIGYFLSQ